MAERITTVIQGTPVEAGGQVFTELVMPVLKACGNRPPREIQQFYAGLLSTQHKEGQRSALGEPVSSRHGNAF